MGAFAALGAATFFAVFGASLMFTIEADGFADISNAVMYILLPDGVNRYGDENMRNSFSLKSVEGGRPDPFQFRWLKN